MPTTTTTAIAAHLREITVDDRSWIVGMQGSHDASAPPYELLFVPADGPVGARPRRVPTERALPAFDDAELVVLLRDAR